MTDSSIVNFYLLTVSSDKALDYFNREEKCVKLRDGLSKG